MIKLKALTQYLDGLLELNKIPDDSSNNGLQIEGTQKINNVIFGVDACLAIAEIAAEKKADFIFVHHGLSWKEGFKYLTGNSARTFSTLFKNSISLYGAHLPLDAHPELGHNAQIAKSIILQDCKPFAKYANVDIGIKGKLKKTTTLANLAKDIDQKLETNSVIYGDKDSSISKIGIISGGPGSLGIEAAVESELDCLITGEVYHGIWHLIQETGINVIAAGHYRTEKPGILAVMQLVQKKFKLDCEFIELPTGL
ncbi:MAG: Nif3-like dinuclear metal center hexameric protein [Candidatus Marinimicrobia bacterium]|nr:Nif3-like dinuclear metal center hexameric protein [Candidatus Neomarinimicrobiota bacterium]